MVDRLAPSGYMRYAPDGGRFYEHQCTLGIKLSYRSLCIRFVCISVPSQGRLNQTQSVTRLILVISS